MDGISVKKKEKMSVRKFEAFANVFTKIIGGVCGYICKKTCKITDFLQENIFFYLFGAASVCITARKQKDEPLAGGVP